MGKRRLYKAERIHTLGTPESERLKVAALNLFDPTAPPPSQKLVFFNCDPEGEGDYSALSHGR